MILGKKNMNWIKNYKLSKKFYEKVFAKIPFDSNESLNYYLDENSTKESWYIKISNEKDFSFISDQTIEKELSIFWEKNNSKNFKKMIPKFMDFFRKLDKSSGENKDIPTDIYVMY